MKTELQTKFEAERENLSEKEIQLETLYWTHIVAKKASKTNSEVTFIKGLLLFVIIVSIIGGVFSSGILNT